MQLNLQHVFTMSNFSIDAWIKFSHACSKSSVMKYNVKYLIMHQD